MIPAEQTHLQVAASTNPGMTGKNNEDRYAVSAYRLEGDPSLPAVLAIVADGVGGHRAGEIAATIAVERISQVVAQSAINGQEPGAAPVQVLKEAIISASQEVLAQSESDPEKRGMASTCACALIIGNRLYIAYVGDSRIYLIRDYAIRQLSTDHTWVQEAIEAGVVEPEQARTHPNAHVIRRHLGSQQQVEPDTRLRLHAGESPAQAEANQGWLLQPGDQLLLCSDGLTDLVLDDEINAALKNKDQEKALEALTSLANRRGGHDNITIITLRVPGAPAPIAPAEVTRPIRRRSRWRILFAGLLLAGFLALLAGLGVFFVWTTLNSTTSPGALTPGLQETAPAGETTRSAPQTPRLAMTSTLPRATLPGAGRTSQPGALPSASPSLTSPPVTYFPTATRAP